MKSVYIVENAFNTANLRHSLGQTIAKRNAQ
jgi:hypothetical protein